jgi:hypothetical protein
VLKYLYYVKIEVSQINKHIPQYFDFQNIMLQVYNHSRCVCYGENVDTCTKNRDLPTKCALYTKKSPHQLPQISNFKKAIASPKTNLVTKKKKQIQTKLKTIQIIMPI